MIACFKYLYIDISRGWCILDAQQMEADCLVDINNINCMFYNIEQLLVRQMFPFVAQC